MHLGTRDVMVKGNSQMFYGIYGIEVIHWVKKHERTRILKEIIATFGEWHYDVNNFDGEFIHTFSGYLFSFFDCYIDEKYTL